MTVLARPPLEARHGTSERWLWLAGLAGGVLLLGPILSARALYGLDVTVLDDVRVPPGVWGIGPVLPRRGLWIVPVSALSHLVSGAHVVAAVLVLASAAAFVGAARLATGAPTVARAGAGTLYAFGPFVATRIGVGHLSLVVAIGVLPWALPALSRVSRAPGPAFRWGVALSLTGVFGGLLAFVVLAASMLTEHRHLLRSIAVTIGSQATWLVPGAIVASQPRVGALASSATFGTDAHGPVGLLGLATGRGFWLPTEQVGLGGVAAAALGLVIVALAAAGRRRARTALGPVLERAALIAAALVVLPALPVAGDAYAWLTGREPFAVLRESQRLLPAALLWLAVAAAFGVLEVARRARAARRAVVVLPLALGIVLAGPGTWGVAGGLHPGPLPPEWIAARDIVQREPGPIVALPWSQHVDLAVAGGQRVLTPVPELLGPDVIVGTDAQPADGAVDQVDARQAAVARALAADDQGTQLSRSLQELGVRWVAALDAAGDEHIARLATDPGLSLVAAGHGLRLFAVAGWRGAAVTADGAAVRASSTLTPLAAIDGRDRVTWFRAGEHGWLRGLEPATITADGALLIPAGTGPVWFWPSLVVITTYALTGALVLFGGSSARWPRRPRSGIATPDRDSYVQP